MGTIRVFYKLFKVINTSCYAEYYFFLYVVTFFRDLYGCIGTPSIMSRTIIVGKDVNTVRRILFVLSYFIRCNEVYERMEHMIPIESQFEERKKVWMKSES